MNSYIDLHTHTTISDGNLSPSELIQEARKNNVTHLAITDHNLIHHNLSELQAQNSDIELIPGVEISATYSKYNLSEEIYQATSIHIIGLYFDQTTELDAFLEKNLNEEQRISRIDKIIQKLKKNGVDLECSTYKAFRLLYYPNRLHIGRPQIAKVMVEKGYVKSIEEAFDLYIGEYGERKAYVPAEDYASMEETIKAIHKANGVAVLCHPFSYGFTSKAEVAYLIKHFAYFGGDAVECYYNGYSKQQQLFLISQAERFLLLPSAGSDYHGNNPKDNLSHNFSDKILEPLFFRHLEIYYYNWFAQN